MENVSVNEINHPQVAQCVAPCEASKHKFTEAESRTVVANRWLGQTESCFIIPLTKSVLQEENFPKQSYTICMPLLLPLLLHCTLKNLFFCDSLKKVP